MRYLDWVLLLELSFIPSSISVACLCSCVCSPECSLFFPIRSWVMWRKQERSWKLPLKKIRYLQTLCIISRRMKRVDENQSVPVIYSLDTLIFLSYQCWCGIKDTLDISTIALNKVPLMKSNHLSVALFLYNIEFFPL